MKIKLKPVPTESDTRIKQGFLWFPKVINNEIRWLTYQKWLQRYCVFWEEAWWVDECWIDENKPAI